MRRGAPAGSGGRRADLHTHTTYSDGLLTPVQLIARAREQGLAAIAITDHDSVEGLPLAMPAAGGALELIPGVEISTSADGMDLHILGLYVDPDHPELRERLARFHDERLRRVESILARLADLGVGVSLDTVLALAGPGVVGRPHVAEAMVRSGHVADLDEAFRRYLGSQGIAFVSRPSFRPAEAISLIHAAGGVSVLAHPGASLSDLVVERLADLGLRALEVWHPQHGVSTVRRYRALARQLNLLETGGSDFHGPDRGTELGGVSVPLSVVVALKDAAGIPG
jgi:predicted metal-dependent phosphoesterase TrpH